METEKELKELRDKNDFVFQRWYAYAAEISSELGTEAKNGAKTSMGQMHPMTHLRNTTAAICSFHSLTISHKKCLQGNLYKLSTARLFT